MADRFSKGSSLPRLQTRMNHTRYMTHKLIGFLIKCHTHTHFM